MDRPNEAPQDPPDDSEDTQTVKNISRNQTVELREPAHDYYEVHAPEGALLEAFRSQPKAFMEKLRDLIWEAGEYDATEAAMLLPVQRYAEETNDRMLLRWALLMRGSRLADGPEGIALLQRGLELAAANDYEFPHRGEFLYRLGSAFQDRAQAGPRTARRKSLLAARKHFRAAQAWHEDDGTPEGERDLRDIPRYLEEIKAGLAEGGDA